MNTPTREEIKKSLLEQADTIGIKGIDNLPNESKRLEEIKRLGILEADLSEIQVFNNITQLCANLTGSSLSFINILGSDVQQCKVIHGLNEEQKYYVSEVPRKISVCQFCLEKPSEPLIIENISKNSLTEKHAQLEIYKDLKFYAGIPLVTSKGYAIGSLCVVDSEEKSLSQKELEQLRLLADSVVSLLENNTNLPSGKNDDSTARDVKPIDTKYFSSACVLFMDFVGFSKHAEKNDPGELLEILNTFFSGFDQISKKNNVVKIKTIGDCYMAASGINSQSNDYVYNICNAAMNYLKLIDAINMQRELTNKDPWNVRIGIHTGPLIYGFSGDNFDVWGDTVNIAARLESTSQPGKISISEKTASFLSKSKITEREIINLKNKGEFKTYFLESL